MKNITAFFERLQAFLASRGFFWGVVGLLIVQALWIALSSHYPMAFDEDFHLGIIRIYAKHLSPWLASQPAGADLYGAVARDPSYLYHYLMSFPYRLIAVVSHDFNVQVLFLRFINIGLLASSLVIYRKLLAKLDASPALINGCLLFFVLIPVVPLLAAQINYDNLFIPAVALSLLLSLRFIERLRKSKFDLAGLLWLLITLLLTGLVKYAYLPVLLAITAYLIIETFRILKQSKLSSRRLVVVGIRSTPRIQLIMLTSLFVISLGLWSQRYIENFARYHTPIPACHKVLTIKQCSAYGPWIRDYNFAVNNVDEGHNPIVYFEDWLYGMWLRLYFTVDGPATLYQSRGPLPVPGLSAIAICVTGLGVLMFGWRRLWNDYDKHVIGLFAAVSLTYVATLYFDNYRAYLRTGQPVAINGRYLLPFIPLILMLTVVAGKGIYRWQPRIAGLVITIVLITQIWGGGALTYILRSNDSWYRPSVTVRTANHAVQSLLGPVTPGFNQPAEFLR